MSSYPKLHSRSAPHTPTEPHSPISRIHSGLAFILVLVAVILVAITHLMEYEIVCIGGYDGPHENVIGICPEEEKAFVTYSKLRFNCSDSLSCQVLPTFREDSGYRTFVIIQMVFTSELFPLVTVQILTFMLWRFCLT